MQNETLNVIAKRFSCRAFTSEAPTSEALRQIANAAIQAPSGVNRQPWRVVVVKNEALIADMEAECLAAMAALPDKAMYERIVARGGRVFYGAKALVMVPIEVAAGEGAVMDCGILSENIALAATSLGLGSCICGLAGFAFAGARAEEFGEKLGFPQGYEFGICVLLGHVAIDAQPHEPDESKISFID